MDVKQGYKQTEVGVIPEDWEVKELGFIGEVIRGASPRPKGDKRYYGGNIPRLMVEDVTRDGKRVVPQVDFLTEDGAKKSRPCKEGTLTIVCSGTVGIPSFLGVDACIHDGFLALINIQKNISEDYLYHQLYRLKEDFDSSATHGGVFTNLTTSSVNDFKVAIPPTKAEQEAIAEALSDADALVESLEQLIAKKRQMKQGAMQELLTGNKRLPGFSGEWAVRRLGDVIDEIGDGATPSTSNPRNFGGNIHWVVIDDICDEITKTQSTLTERGLKSCAAKLWPVGSLILSTGATIGEVGIAHIPVATKQGICGIVVKRSKVDALFLKYWFNANKFLLVSKSQGSTIKEVRVPTLVQFEICLPKINEQAAIASVLSDMAAEIAALESKLVKARWIKQGMMHNLLTGKIRLV